MPFRFLIGDTDGVVYAGSPEGAIVFYLDQARDGTPRWANAGQGQSIGTGFESLSNVFTAGNGIIYGVQPNGDLMFYRDEARDGTTNWANGGAGQRVGTGWGVFSHLVNGDDGVIYAIAPNGDLFWFKDLARDGSANWHPASGTKIGSNWNRYTRIMPGGQGALYAIDKDGNIFWTKDRNRNGTRSWVPRRKIGDGWGNFVDVISAGDGVFYAITPDGFMLFYRDLGRDGTENWAFNGAGVTMGGGWTATPAKPMTVQGYAKPLTVGPGETVHFHVSALGTYDVSFLRLKQQTDGSFGTVVGSLPRQAAVGQAAPADCWANGCNWSETFSFPVPANAKSGVYSARCVDFANDEYHLSFVVHPGAANRGEVAVLANTNTWTAYNDYGGRSKYSLPIGTTLSFERPNPPITPAELNTIDHLLRAELWLLNWLENEGYKVDVWSDLDFHRGITNFNNYKALVLSTHPEYWSEEMLDHLEAYLAAGGSLLYLGGNGIFEKVEINEATGKMICMAGDPGRNRDDFYFRNLAPTNRPERAVLGVAYRYDNFMTFAPYQVLDATHRFFAGTGVANGTLIGENGINGRGASGWEMDTAMAGTAPPGRIVSATGDDDRGAPPANLQIIARGTNPGFGADMTCYDTPAGGRVFSVGSISFIGSMVGDAVLQRILRNVLAECGASIT